MLQNAALGERVATREDDGARATGRRRTHMGFWMGMTREDEKANAAFRGLGSTKRIILGEHPAGADVRRDEIAGGHGPRDGAYKHGKSRGMIRWGTVTTFVGPQRSDDLGLHWRHGPNRLRASLEHWTVSRVGLCLLFRGWRNADDKRLLPARVNEKADARRRSEQRIATLHARHEQACGDRENLADLSPHPLVAFLLHDSSVDGATHCPGRGTMAGD